MIIPGQLHGNLIFERPRESSIINEWLVSAENGILYLYGPAGAGKTTMLSSIINQLPEKNFQTKTIYYDFANYPLTKQRKALAAQLKNHNPLSKKLIILDGIYDAAAAGEILEEISLAYPGETKILVCSRKAPSGIWMVSPVLCPATTCLEIKDLTPEEIATALTALNLYSLELIKKIQRLSHGRLMVLKHILENPDNYQEVNNFTPALAQKIIRVFMRETDHPDMRQYIETAAAARRFNRDLLEQVNGNVPPLAFRSLQELSFVYTGETGMYIDPILSKAILSAMKEHTYNKLLNAINTTPRQDMPGFKKLPSWPKDHVINATRETLRAFDKMTVQTNPLYKLWISSTELTSQDPAKEYKKFEALFNNSLEQLHAQNPIMARALKVIYIQRSTTLRQLSRELNIPERTFYRKIQTTLYELGKKTLDQMEGVNINEE
jgi:GTPase SAR1 family protein